jgi:redox-sensitive bicupin YhaK (pirin superfamily)
MEAFEPTQGTAMETRDPDLELVMAARGADLPGGLHVLRAIPQAQRRMVGPFVFVDQMGPAQFPQGDALTVLSHPHIGLSTITWLFEGEGEHLDSLGTVQRLLPGEVNWMTAGGGIVHAERMRPSTSGRMFGMQIWVALPKRMEDQAPSFQHSGADGVPLLEDGGVSTRLIAGSAFGATAGVKGSSPLFYAEVRMEAGSVLRLPADYDERAAFVMDGAVSLTQATVRAGEIAFFQRGAEVLLCAAEPARLMLLGGEPLDGPRYIFWNFVSSSRDRLKQAADDWRHRRFARIPGETTYIPLPEDGDAAVYYP